MRYLLARGIDVPQVLRCCAKMTTGGDADLDKASTFPIDASSAK